MNFPDGRSSGRGGMGLGAAPATARAAHFGQRRFRGTAALYPQPVWCSNRHSDAAFEEGKHLGRVIPQDAGVISGPRNSLIKTRPVDPEDPNSPHLNVWKLYMARYPQGWEIGWVDDSF
jgi:hypothetical protein